MPIRPGARRAAALLATFAFVAMALPGRDVSPVRAADEYTMATVATYDVQPDAGVIGVSVDVSFTNTTPDPAGQFSVFDAVKLAIHDQATDVAASDDEGALEVAAAVESDVNVATVQLREDLRYEQTATFTLTYALPDGSDPHLRVRPSVVVFPAWSFGTSGEVRVTIPEAYEVRVDGDPLTLEEGTLVSGDIPDPSNWLALVTGVRAADYTTLESAIPLSGGTADLQVRAFADDEAWGTATVDLVERALPLIEEEVGLPYPRLGQLVLTEAVPADTTGFAEAAPGGTEILVAYDQPPFTVIHQLVHVWISPSFVDARWIREGLASSIAGRVADELGVDRPYDPAAVTTERADAAFPLDAWSANAGPDGEAYGYAASWDALDQITATVGVTALHTVLARVAASIGPYQPADVQPEPNADGMVSPEAPLDTRGFLDHLETVAQADLTDLFRARILTETDVALLEPRAAARERFSALVTRAGAWGAPDPVRGAMTAWSFDDAQRQIDAAMAWLEERDALRDRMEEAGLAAPDRLQQAYRAHGGGPEAQAELDAERAVVDAYAETAADVNAPRSFLERVGLLGGSDPAQQLAKANGQFTDGDLQGAVDSIAEAQRMLSAAEGSGIVRLVSAALLVAILLAVAVILFRRRSSYTAAP
jgi:hypothetical protein